MRRIVPKGAHVGAFLRSFWWKMGNLGADSAGIGAFHSLP
jgi:hypothetical protein